MRGVSRRWRAVHDVCRVYELTRPSLHMRMNVYVYVSTMLIDPTGAALSMSASKKLVANAAPADRRTRVHRRSLGV